MATKYWSCKSDINLRLNLDKKIAAKSRQKKIWREKCKILPTILGAAVALRCKRCSIFISVTEFREFAFSRFLSLNKNRGEGVKFAKGTTDLESKVRFF